jgi:hypothetical protein
VRAGGRLPVVGRTPDAILVLAQSENQSAGAVVDRPLASDGCREVWRASPHFAERDSSTASSGWLTPFRAADEQVAQAVITLNQSPDSLLLPNVARARESASEELGGVAHTKHSASQILLNLPACVGEIPSR